MSMTGSLYTIPEHIRHAHQALAGVLPAEPDPRGPRREVHPQAVARASQDRALPQPPQRDQGRPGDNCTDAR